MTSLRATCIHSPEAFRALDGRWDSLAAAAAGGLFLSHAWLSAWWRAFSGVDELWIFTVEDDDGRLVAGWPLHLRVPRGGRLKTAELRLVGDLGGAERSLLCLPGSEAEVAALFAQTLLAARGWDVLDVPMGRRELGEAFERALGQKGVKLDRSFETGRPYLPLPLPADWSEFARARGPERAVIGAAYAPADLDVAAGLGELLRLLRKEWAAREVASASPAADPQAVDFLYATVPELHARGLARVGVLAVEGRGAIAADLVVTDGERAVQLLSGADPDFAAQGASEQITLASMEEAVRAGARRFELAAADEPSDTRANKLARDRVQRLRVWNATTAARLHRGVAVLTGAVRDIGKITTSEVVQRAVSRVATYSTLHLYRGELFTRNLGAGDDLGLALCGREDFDALPAPERERFLTRLDLQEGYCRQKWDRGDTVVVATRAAVPAGILWCARNQVLVPDIGQKVRPGAGECYIHDVYVHPDERGRQVAPAMLDFLARELRRRDVYRAWALIERTNVASTRAFEKAAYASVADVVYVRMGLASRLIVRPPDPEARAFLGLS